MKPLEKRWAILLVALVLGGMIGWNIASAVAPASQMEDQMKMMKQKMMSRPKAMANADKAVQGQKQTAIKAGKYACCLKHPCDFCALKMGECPCGMNVAKDMPNCNECKGAWYAGDGAVPGKTADQIKTLPRPLGEM